MGKAKANILLLGSLGAGKSTLAQVVSDRKYQGNEDGKRKTIKIYQNNKMNCRLIDIAGAGCLKQRVTVKQVLEYIRAAIKHGESDATIDVIWYCINSEKKRFGKKNIRQILSVYQNYPKVPVLIVLTKARDGLASRKKNEYAVRNAIKKYDSQGKIVFKGIVHINTLPYLGTYGERVEINGIEELINNTKQVWLFER